MFSAECGERRGVENRPEQNQLVQSSRVFPVAAKKDRDQADCENDSGDAIRPDHLAGNHQDRQACRRIHFFASASRFSFAQSLSDGTPFIGGPPCVPQAHGPCILASVMQKHDFVCKQAQTYTTLFLPCFCESSAAILCEPFIKQTRANESSSPRDVLNLIRLFMT